MGHNTAKSQDGKQRILYFPKIESQESCIINAGLTMSYFNLEKNASQGDPVPVYLFILC